MTTLFQEIVKATNNVKVGFLYTSEPDRSDLVERGLVEIRKEMIDPNNSALTATRATEKGLRMATAFEIESNIPLPKTTRRSSLPKYPIDDLNIGQCFHVSTNENEDIDTLGKRIGSVVSNANAKYSVSKNPIEYKNVIRKNRKTGEEKEISVEVTIAVRRFTARKTEPNDPKGTGIRIFRVELPD